MRRLLLRVCLCILVGIQLSSCIRVVMEEFPEFTPVPAINSILVAGNPIDMQLSFAEKIDTTYLNLINDAEVYLFMNGELIETLTPRGSGRYRSSQTATPENTYGCEILLDGNEVIQCMDSMPKYPSISILDQTNTAAINNEGFYTGSITFSFWEDPAHENYYEIQLSLKEDENERNLPVFNTDYEFLLNEGIEPFSTSTLLFSDQLMESGNLKLTLHYDPMFHSGGSNSQFFPEHTLFLEVRSISATYYHFKKQFYLYERNRYPEFVEGVISPFPIHSNVENGQGIFAAYAYRSDYIIVEEEEITYK